MTSQRPTSGLAVTSAALRIIPLALLIIIAMAGLRGNVTKPSWTGSHATDIATGIALFVVFAILLIITLARRRTALRAMGGGESGLDPRGKLRVALLYILATAMIADVVAVLIALHLKLPMPNPKRNSQSAQPPGGKPSLKAPRIHPGSGGSFPLAAFLWGLLIVALIVVTLLIWRWLATHDRVTESDEDDFIAEDSATLREAVESGRAALRTFDDAKAAIIACYAAMEESLAEHGAARAAADTPDELLARATQAGVVHGTAPARLTALFYEARFSSHPMDQTQREAAEQALNELARALDSQRGEPQEAGA
jgi:hypothetical protein